MAPQNSVPPQLPPSVEEAYRRKCVELKRRNRQVEEANDAARIRIARIKRQVEKLRVERAFLLEQLTKRTSTNVEDSEGSPSPPPTGQDFDLSLLNKDPAAMLSDADANVRKPKEKPLRNKRGHGKKDVAAADAADGASEAAGDNLDAADAKDEELPDAAPAQDAATPAPEESKEDLARLAADNAPEDRDLEKDGELPGESEDSAIGAFNVFAAWRRAELAKDDKPDIDIRATLLAEWNASSTSAKKDLADKFTELGASSKILEQIREHGWEPPSMPTRVITKEKAVTPQVKDDKDEDVDMEDGDTQKSEAPADADKE